MPNVPSVAWDSLFSGNFAPLYPNPHTFPSEFLPNLSHAQLAICERVWNRVPEVHTAGINGSIDWCTYAELVFAEGGFSLYSAE